jgi:hypothetical protein
LQVIHREPGAHLASRTGVALMAYSFTNMASTTRWPGGKSPRAMRSSSVSRMNSRSDLTGGKGIKTVLGKELGVACIVPNQLGGVAAFGHHGLRIVHDFAASIQFAILTRVPTDLPQKND